MSIWKKLLVCIIFIAFYFSLLRTTRSYSVDKIRSNIEFKNVEMLPANKTGIYFIYNKEDFSKTFLFKMPFGMFFLIGTLSLILMNTSLRDFGVLCSLQFGLWIVAFFCMIPGSNGNLFFLEMMDMIIRYLMPLSSLGFPAYLIIQQKSNAEMASYES